MKLNITIDNSLFCLLIQQKFVEYLLCAGLCLGPGHMAVNEVDTGMVLMEWFTSSTAVEKSGTRRACKWAGLCEGRCPWRSVTDPVCWEQARVSWSPGRVTYDLRTTGRCQWQWSPARMRRRWDGRCGGEESIRLRGLSFPLKAAGDWRGVLNRPVTPSDVHFQGIVQAPE